MMWKKRKNIKSLYTINMIEGEGVGTAYEYYVKLKKLRKFINSIGRPKRILIAGLPEKYGQSMDFFLLGQMLHADMVVIDDRFDALERAKNTISILRTKNIFNEKEITFLKLNNIVEFNSKILGREKFDLALSCEVFQRIYEAQQSYISNLSNVANNLAIFVPNRGNESHAKLSGLKSIHLNELLKHFQYEHLRATIYDYGYIDMPPFPPGLSRSQEKRQRASESHFEGFLMKVLEIYSLCENIIPQFVKEKIAHIIYIMVKNDRYDTTN